MLRGTIANVVPNKFYYPETQGKTAARPQP